LMATITFFIIVLWLLSIFSLGRSLFSFFIWVISLVLHIISCALSCQLALSLFCMFFLISFLCKVSIFLLSSIILHLIFFLLWMSLVHPHFHLFKMPLLNWTSFDTMLEIFKKEKGSMVEDNLIHINNTLPREEFLMNLDLNYNTQHNYI
jgi:predicted membrane protein